MARIAVISVSDGRPAVHAEITDHIVAQQARLVAALVGEGHSVATATEIVSSNELAVRAGRECAALNPDLTIVNTCVWTFPSFTVLVAGETRGALLLFCNVDPGYPGMVGMLAAGGALDQIGRRHVRAWGDVSDAITLRSLASVSRAAAAVQGLRGSTFGRIGGRPMGMNTAVSATDQWMREFGIDVEEVDQFELVRRCALVEDTRARGGREWLEKMAAGVHYDGRRLTPELLERQVRTYHAMQSLIEDLRLDFCGIKGQPELTDHFCTMDIAEAFLNDPYDWEGSKAPVVCSTEADMDGALTMQVLSGLSGTPALFADLRHFHADLGIWDLCNSGQHATWFATRSDDAAENLAAVNLYPEEFYFPAGGATVHHLAAPGAMTMARLSRLDGRYRMQVMSGEFVQFEDGVNQRLMRASTYAWPHAFARLDVPDEEMLSRFGSNHIHAIPGDHVAALQQVCAFLDIRYEGFGASV
jgi:L-fucose isomerase